RAGAGVRSGRAARARAGDPAQPERSRPHQRREHDGAARAALRAGHGGDGRRRCVWRGCERVVAMSKGAFGGFAEYAICAGVSAFAMPEEIPLPDAAALYFPFHLAWLGLYDRAELKSGETVLVHAAAGG